MQNTRSISIILICSNNQHIKLIIDIAYNMLSFDDEIIVVDDHSSKYIIEILKKLQDAGKVRLLQAKLKGNRSYNRNLGTSNAKNDILLFLDGDMVLCPNTLQALRAAHMKDEAIAYIGPKHNMHYSDIHSALYSGITYERYLELICTEEGRLQLMYNPMFHDERLEFFQNNNLAQFNWTHYYTGASSVEKDVFDIIGGFDQHFTTWGSEDVDLGYRISQHGSIGFLPQFRSIHIPHPKDILKRDITNAENTLKMLQKYKTWEFEVLYAFSGRPEVFHSFYNIINQMRMLKLAPMHAPTCYNSLEVHPVSSNDINGLIVHYDNYGNRSSYASLAMALDFPDKYFDTVYAADTIFLYPPFLTSRIIQELFRIGKHMLILPTGETTRIDWGGKVQIMPYHSNPRLVYRSDDIMDFRFHCEDDGSIEVTSEVFCERKIRQN